MTFLAPGLFRTDKIHTLQMGYVKKALQYLPGFPLSHIGFSIHYARQFLSTPNISFNMFQKVLVGPLGSKFLRDCAEAQRPVYVWTVNEEQWMRWSIAKGVDGVITDNPELFRDICKKWGSDTNAEAQHSAVVSSGNKGFVLMASMALDCLFIQLLALVFTVFFTLTGRLNRVTISPQQRMLISGEST